MTANLVNLGSVEHILYDQL